MPDPLLIELPNINGPLFAKQRTMVQQLIEEMSGNDFVEDERTLLEGLENLLDHIADQLHDKYDIPCLLADGTLADGVDLTKLDADELSEILADLGVPWEQITETDPERSEPPTDAEISLVRDYLTKRQDAVNHLYMEW